MKSTAATPDAFLAEQPEGGREALAAAREMVNAHLPSGFVEAIGLRHDHLADPPHSASQGLQLAVHGGSPMFVADQKNLHGPPQPHRVT